ncbi:hypothetical protein EIP86_006701 [Pleurotus ostreatoroseus]|nr:hypothetical protein EIP86_006701 [Pleurotus ostreatoroseus]
MLMHRANRNISSSGLTALQRAQYKIQLQWLEDGLVPQAEYIAKSNGLINPANNTKYLVVMQGLLHPLSRGTIHINDTNPLAHPVIDPKYLSFSYGGHSDCQTSTRYALSQASGWT